MGYTHYWTFKKPKRSETQKIEKLYQKAIKDITKMAKLYQSECIWDTNRLSGYTVHSEGYGGVKINGKQENSHGDFILREHYRQNFSSIGEGFSFCKTACKPYDEVVVAALCILKYYLKGYIQIDSSGSHDAWRTGHLLAQRILPKVINPLYACIKACGECGKEL